MTVRQMSEQKRFVGRLLPDYPETIVAGMATCSIGANRIAVDLVGIEEDISANKRLAVALDPIYAINRHFDPRVRIPRAFTEIVQFEVKGQVAVAHDISQPSGICDLASPLPAYEDRRALR